MAAKDESADGSGAMSSAPEKEEGLFQQADFPSNLLQNFQDMKSQEQLCDVSLLVDGWVFQAHRVVLSAVSPVFRAMFTNQMAEAKQDQIELPEMEAEAFEELLEFAYSGKVRMTLGSAESLMAAASFLQINSVVEFCAGFFQARLQVGTVLNIRQLADRFNCSSLMEAADRFIHKYFVPLSKTDDFRCLSQEHLTRILTKDQLFVSSEHQVLQALMCWVEADPGARGDQLGTLLPCVHLSLLTPEALADYIQTHPLIRDNLQCLQLLNAAMVYKLIPSRRPLLQPFQTKPRFCMDAPGLIYVIGGHDEEEDALSSVEVYDPLTARWSSVQPMKTARVYAATAIMDGLLYAIGGVDDAESLESVEVFDPRSGRWEEVASLNERREGACAAVVDNRLFICGGHNGENSLSSVEAFDGGQWTLTSPMHHRRNGAGVAVLDGKIYMMGGGGIVGTVERLDLETMQWTMLQPMRTPRSFFGACSLNGRLFVCGGLDGQDNCHIGSVEMYDPNKDEWEEVASMNVARSDVALVPNCGSLYAIGGTHGYDILSSMEMFNPEEGVWRMGPSFQTAREGVSAIDVLIPPEDQLP